MKQIIYLVPHNHFDPTWRRCFARPAVYHGVTVRSYAEVEAHCINAWLALAPRGYPFSEGQTAVWRKYLEQYPEKLAEIRRLAGTEQLAVLLAGETVQDSSMPAAEGLVRNFLLALPLYRELVAADHPALKIASCEDAFGNSPNYPQVLRGVGAEAVLWLFYRPCPEDIWVGIDGTQLPFIDNHPTGHAGNYAKHAPCPDCRGVGCASCAETGLLFVDGFDLDALHRGCEDLLARYPEAPWVDIRFGTEEVLPDARVIDFVAAWNREHTESEMRFATPLDIYRADQPTLAAALRERDEQASVDLQPAMPGCMVTRIRCKQRTRAIAYHLLAAEAALATRAWQAGAPCAPPADFTEAWRLVTFNQFHDAITGTHIDNAYSELMDMLDRAEEIAGCHLPLPCARPAYGAFTAVSGTQTCTLGALEVTFDRQGILAIACEGRDLFGPSPAPWHNRRRRARIAELTLEPDFGDAWGKRIQAPDTGMGDFYTVLLGDYHTLVEASASAIRWTGRYTGGDPKVKRLSWTVTASPSADGRRLEFRTEVDWDTESRRLRVQVPVHAADLAATFEVPFGFRERTFDAGKLDFSIWHSNTQEFPTLHWVRKAVDAQSGVVLFNKGLPCNRWQSGVLDLSLLRSPEFAFAVVEPGSYEFWDIDGQRDTGEHLFEYALLPYTDALPMGELVRTGYAYNLPAPLQPPFAVAGDVVVTAWKAAEDGHGWILRLQEAGGEGTTVNLTFDEPREVTVTNLLEQPQTAPVRGAQYSTPLHRHGILTLYIR